MVHISVVNCVGTYKPLALLKHLLASACALCWAVARASKASLCVLVVFLHVLPHNNLVPNYDTWCTACALGCLISNCRFCPLDQGDFADEARRCSWSHSLYRGQPVGEYVCLLCTMHRIGSWHWMIFRGWKHMRRKLPRPQQSIGRLRKSQEVLGSHRKSQETPTSQRNSQEVPASPSKTPGAREPQAVRGCSRESVQVKGNPRKSRKPNEVTISHAQGSIPIIPKHVPTSPNKSQS